MEQRVKSLKTVENYTETLSKKLEKRRDGLFEMYNKIIADLKQFNAPDFEFEINSDDTFYFKVEIIISESRVTPEVYKKYNQINKYFKNAWYPVKAYYNSGEISIYGTYRAAN
jgi:hypothetical protein